MRTRWRWFAQHATIDSETRTTGAGGAHRKRDTREEGAAGTPSSNATREREEEAAGTPSSNATREQEEDDAHPHRTRYSHNTRRPNVRHERWVEVVAATCGTRLSNTGRER